MYIYIYIYRYIYIYSWKKQALFLSPFPNFLNYMLGYFLDMMTDLNLLMVVLVLSKSDKVKRSST